MLEGSKIFWLTLYSLASDMNDMTLGVVT